MNLSALASLSSSAKSGIGCFRSTGLQSRISSARPKAAREFNTFYIQHSKSNFPLSLCSTPWRQTVTIRKRNARSPPHHPVARCTSGPRAHGAAHGCAHSAGSAQLPAPALQRLLCPHTPPQRGSRSPARQQLQHSLAKLRHGQPPRRRFHGRHPRRRA